MSMNLVAVRLCVLAVCSLSGFTSAFDVGITANLLNFPYTVALYLASKPYPFCTGAIVTARWVLTSCSCMYDRSEPKRKPIYREVVIVVGSEYVLELDRPDGRQYLQKHIIAGVVLPSRQDVLRATKRDQENYYTIYDDNTDSILHGYHLDFALLKTTESMSFSDYVHPIPFNEESTYNIKKKWNALITNTLGKNRTVPDCVVAGWGRQDPAERIEGTPEDHRLVYTRVAYVAPRACELAYCANCSFNTWKLITPDTEVCFKATVLEDACDGDGGAPLYCPWFGGAILGIVSKPGGCSVDVKLPSVYALIWRGYDFISSTMGYVWPPPHVPITRPQNETWPM